ncbi:MAG: amidohydrolase [Clostridiaceae bacterium]|jgi:predicted TIM-barrel fold metal-dependent hydrolase|nr:amidohydrolase [Clostridiaceae bacterium]
MKRKIIDFHAHAFPEEIAQKAVNHIGNHYTIKMQGKGILPDLIQSADNAGIDYIVIHSTATRACQVKHINDWVASHTSEKMIGFGTLHPDMPDVEEEFERIVSLGLKGIKLHPDFQGFNADDLSMDRIYSVIDNRLPLLIHCGDEKLDSSSPKRIANVLDKFPRLTIIAAHLGGHKNWQESMEYLVCRDIYMDTSSAIRFMDSAFATKLIKKHGINRIVFGTDYPITYHENELEFFYKLDLSESEREDILYNNAARILGLPMD